jgi:multicomponent Na+:H+ antiporter subunit F
VETIAVICFTLLAVGGGLCVLRAARGPSLADRVLAIDSLLIVGVVGVAVETARTGSGVYLDVLLVVALVAFIGTTAAARFIERRGTQ